MVTVSLYKTGTIPAAALGAATVVGAEALAAAEGELVELREIFLEDGERESVHSE